MNIPQAPPIEERAVQFLTKTADRAIRDKSGPLYRCLVDALQRCNPDCFDGADEVTEYLQRYLWPPVQAEMILEDFPHLPKFPTSLYVNGRNSEVLITDPETRLYDALYIHLLNDRVNIRAGGPHTFNMEYKDLLDFTGLASEQGREAMANIVKLNKHMTTKGEKILVQLTPGTKESTEPTAGISLRM